MSMRDGETRKRSGRGEKGTSTRRRGDEVRLAPIMSSPCVYSTTSDEGIDKIYIRL